MAQTLPLRLEDRAVDAEVQSSSEGTRVRLGDRWYDVEFEPTGRNGLYSLIIDGRSWEVFAHQRPHGWDILIDTRTYAVETATARGRGRGTAVAAEPDGAWTLKSPMAGAIVEVRAAAGDEVAAGDVLVVIESMKMNNEFVSARAGRVAEVRVKPGDRVERDAPLVRVE